MGNLARASLTIDATYYQIGAFVPSSGNVIVRIKNTTNIATASVNVTLGVRVD